GGPRCSPPNPPCHADRNQQRDVAHLAGLAGAGIATRGAALIALRIAQPIRLGIEQGVQRLLHDAPHHPVEVALDPIVVTTTAQSPAHGLHPTRSAKPQIAESGYCSRSPTANYATEAAFCSVCFSSWRGARYPWEIKASIRWGEKSIFFVVNFSCRAWRLRAGGFGRPARLCFFIFFASC